MLINFAGAWLFGTLLDFVFRVLRCWLIRWRYRRSGHAIEGRGYYLMFFRSAIIWPFVLFDDVRRIVRNRRPFPSPPVT